MSSTPAEEPVESAAKKRQCYRRHRSKEGASRESRLPGNLREPGPREVAVNATQTPDQVNARYTAFFLLFKKMPVDERDITNMIAEDVEATCWRLHETIRVRELAATHRLGQMRRLLMLEEYKAWKQDANFDYIETAAETDARRSRSNIVSESFFYKNMFNPRRPHTPDEFTLEVRVDVEQLMMELALSQPVTSQCDSSPRRLPAVYRVGGTQNAATFARDRYGVGRTRSIASSNNGQEMNFPSRNQCGRYFAV